MMLTWWIVPLTFMPISFHCVASETAITDGFFLLFSALWAMFGPTATIPFLRSGALARRVRPTTLRQAEPLTATPYATDREESPVCDALPEKPRP